MSPLCPKEVSVKYLAEAVSRQMLTHPKPSRIKVPPPQCGTNRSIQLYVLSCSNHPPTPHHHTDLTTTPPPPAYSIPPSPPHHSSPPPHHRATLHTTPPLPCLHIHVAQPPLLRRYTRSHHQHAPQPTFDFLKPHNQALQNLPPNGILMPVLEPVFGAPLHLTLRNPHLPKQPSDSSHFQHAHSQPEQPVSFLDMPPSPSNPTVMEEPHMEHTTPALSPPLQLPPDTRPPDSALLRTCVDICRTLLLNTQTNLKAQISATAERQVKVVTKTPS
ncbi:hypothetical protein WMY93_026142 [Mugilogobius chulae]|uniref:Uncharacterized protein n=1 Tax=Mugilogobius chulae TaxID=88201 RepID=A0AAW0N1F1_9GOBI